jgi:hypothetical protein
VRNHTMSKENDGKDKTSLDKRRSCITGKVAFVSPRDANHAVKRMWTYKDCTGMAPYLCEYCGLYHIGHTSEDVQLKVEVITKRFQEEHEHETRHD